MPLVRQLFTRTRQLQSAIKDAGRLREIVGVLLKNGYGYLLENVQIPGMGRIKARAVANGTTMLPAERALAAITELGPTFVKVGQILSTRPDLIPPDFIEAFQTLQDQVAPLSLDGVRAQIHTSLHAKPEDLFQSFDELPLASASIAQVHRATLKSGEHVVLKVQRPGVRITILRDLEILIFLARQIEHNFPEARIFDLVGIVKEIEQSIRAETDFLVEAGNLQRFAQNFAGDPNVHIPQLYREYTTSEILTMEYLDGIKITKAGEAGRDMPLIGRRYLEAAYKMLYRDGFFHGDLHPGNVIILPNDVLGFIDFGMVGRLTPDMKDNVIESMFGLINQDFRMIARVFWNIGIKDESVSYPQFEAQLIDVMERHLVGKQISDLQIGLFFKEILEGAVRHRIRVPTTYTMLFKGLVTTEGMAKWLVPDINPVEVSRPYIEALITERYSQQRLQQEYFFYMTSFARLAHRMPITIGQLISDIEERRLKLTVDWMLPENTRLELRRAEDRKIVAAVAIGTLLAGALTLSHEGHKVKDIPVLSLLLFGSSGVLLFLLFFGYPRR